MSLINLRSCLAALGAGLIATVAMLPQANGALVYENNTTPEQQVTDRAEMRESLGASEKAQATLTAQQAPTPVATAPAAADSLPTAPAPAVETENLSKAELMRRERQREEIKNEDILQERLEELRLRDERRRTDELMAAGAAASSNAPAASATTPAAAQVKEEVVVAPVADRAPTPAPQMSAAPMAPTTAAVVAPAATAGASDPSMVSSVSIAPGSDSGYDRDDRMSIGISGRAGLANLITDNYYFQASAHYSVGIAAEMGAGDYLSVTAGYTYSQFGLSTPNSGYWSAYNYYNQANYQNLNMNENLFDLGVKVHVLGRSSRIRPFVGGGGAYAMRYINFNSAILSQMQAWYPGYSNMSPDYKVNNFLGYLSTGADFRVARNVSVGAEFRYYAVLSDSESSSLSPYFGVGPNQDAAAAGNALARNNFWSILGNVTFTF